MKIRGEAAPHFTCCRSRSILIPVVMSRIGTVSAVGGPGKISLSWSNSGGLRVNVYRATGGYGSGLQAGYHVYEGTGDGFDDIDVEPGTVYYYTVSYEAEERVGPDSLFSSSSPKTETRQYLAGKVSARAEEEQPREAKQDYQPPAFAEEAESGQISEKALHLVSRAQTQMEKGNPEAAVSSLRKAVGLAPDDGFVHGLLGAAYDQLRKKKGGAQGKSLLEEQLRAFRTAVSLEPDTPSWHLELGMAYSDKGLHTRAVDELEKAVALEPVDEMYARCLTKVSDEFALKAPDPNLDDYIERLEGQLPSAAEELRVADRLKSALVQKSFRLANRGEIEPALRAAERSLEVGERDSLGLRAVAKALWADGRSEEAIETMEEAAGVDEISSPSLVLDLAQCCLAEDRVEDAEHWAEEGLKGLEEWKALMTGEKYIELGFLVVEARLHGVLGQALYRRESYEEVPKHMSVAASVDPQCHLVAAAVHQMSGSDKKRDTSIRKWLKQSKDPDVRAEQFDRVVRSLQVDGATSVRLRRAVSQLS